MDSTLKNIFGGLMVGAAVISFTMVSFSDAVLADNAKMDNFISSKDGHTRYPGDKSVDGGTVRLNGTEKGAYIEKCRWVMNSNFGKGFGLTQRCVRYTMENTQAPSE